jgi:hypothetical protein
MRPASASRVSATPTLGIVTVALLAGGIAFPATATADEWHFDICPDQHEGVVVDSPTTCPFAENVHNAWYANGQPIGSPFTAWSPVTGGRYVMECNGQEPLTGVTPGGLSTRCEDIPDTGVKIVLW